MEDPIVAEVRKLREAHAARFDYDVDAIFNDLKRLEREQCRTLVSLAPKQPVHAKNAAKQPPQTSR